MIQLVYWEIRKARFESEAVVIITKAHIAQRKIVQYMGKSVPRPQLLSWRNWRV